MLPLIFLHLLLAGAPKAVPDYKPIPKVLHIASLLAAQADTAMTIHSKLEYGRGATEADPFARPIVGLPNPAYEAVSMGIIVGLNLLVDRMAHSPHWHKFARPILAAQIAGNCYGFVYTFRQR
jgi:hypothetical protein